MRLGVLAAVIFVALACGLFYSSVTNQSLIDSSVQNSLNTMQSASKVTQGGNFGVNNFITLIQMPFSYFNSVITIVQANYNNPLWTSGNWALVPYFTVSPLTITLLLGFFLLLIGILQKQF